VAVGDDSFICPSSLLLGFNADKRAAKILANTVFRTGNAPLIQTVPPPGRMPQAWLTEAMTLAYVFMVIHETSHQGPQGALRLSCYAPHIGAAYAGAALYDITLDENQRLLGPRSFRRT
jgi:hypothetical protein